MLNEIIKLTKEDIPAKISYLDHPSVSESYIPLHYHSEIEILWVHYGNLQCFIGREQIDLYAEDIIVINRGIPHSTHTMKNTLTHMLQINAEKILFSKSASGFLTMLLSANENPYLLFKKETVERKKLSSYLSCIFSEYINADKGGSTIIYGYLNIITGFLIRKNLIICPEDIQNSKSLNKIAPAIAYIEKNYSNKISIDDLSKTVMLNPNYFCRLFKAATNHSCIEFINIVRIMHAEKLMHSTAKSILEISMEVGYSSPSYFNRIFKEIKGYSPSYYRKIKYGGHK